MKENFPNSMKKTAWRVIKNPTVLRAVFSAIVLSEIVSPTPILADEIKPSEPVAPLQIPLDEGQKGALRYGVIAILTGGYLLRVSSVLRENEGKTELQKAFANGGLGITGLGTAAIDVLISTIQF